MSKIFGFVRKNDKALLLFGALVMLGVAVGASGNVSALNLDNKSINPVYLKYLEDVRNGEGAKWKLTPSMFVPQGSGEEGYGAETELPSAYNLVTSGYATQIKNQGSEGICWAYALTTAMESNLLKKKDTPAVFSAKQLDYLLAPGSEYYGYLNSAFEWERTLGDGSNIYQAGFVLSNASVPADEGEFFAKMQLNDSDLAEYKSYGEFQDINTINIFLGNEVPAYTTPMSNALVSGMASDYIVNEYTTYYPTANINEIKEAVYNNGAVYVGTYSPGTPNCYDAATNTVVDRGYSVCGENYGHAMAIVGWDDTHVYTDPATNTEKVGAFILQNSWGNSDLLVDYRITYDNLVAEGLIDQSQLTEEQIQQLKDAIADYNAYEFVYLAYDFERSENNGATIVFASIDMAQNSYEYIADSVEEAEGFGDTTDESGSSSIIYTYDAGDVKQRIEMIALDMHMLALEAPLNVTILVDDGDGYKEFGTITLPKNVSVKRAVKATKKIDVTGGYKVKVDFGDVTGVDEYADLFTTVVYANDAPDDGGDSEGGDSEGGDSEGGETEDEEDIKVPNTGWFAGGISGGVFTVSLVMLGLGTTYVMRVIYKNRRQIFHKVKFDKK